MIDQTDLKIIQLLKDNSRLQWKEIGEMIHMTGQGVATRIHKLEELGIIEKYTLKLNDKMLGMEIIGFVTVHMTTTDHKGFIHFLQSHEGVVEAYRTSGGGCYMIKVVMHETDELNQFLELLLRYANYSLTLSINQVKG